MAARPATAVRAAGCGLPGPGRPGLEVGKVVGEPGQVGVGLGAHRPAEALIELRLVEAPVPVVLGQLVGDLGPLGIRNSHRGIGARARAVPPCPQWHVDAAFPLSWTGAETGRP